MPVTASATILAGQLVGTFNLTPIDNNLQDGNQLVFVGASAPGFTNVAASILIVDDDTPPAIVTQPGSQTIAVGGHVTFSVAATGKAPLSYAWRRVGSPIAGANFYAVCSAAATAFPADPAGGTVLSMGDDTYSQITLSGGNTVAIYNNRRNVLFVGSNGSLKMNSGATSYAPTYTNHFAL